MSMNPFLKYSITYAQQRNYLDDLYSSTECNECAHVTQFSQYAINEKFSYKSR